MKNEIYIFSDRLHSGKTTLLKQWTLSRNDVAGFLSPVIESKRYFLNLETQENRLLEVEKSALKIGSYHFDEAVFKWAVQELEKHFKSDKSWIIIDEIGPLEIKYSKGFHDKILHFINSKFQNKKILFVVRDFLVADFIKKYQIDNVKILPLGFFKPDSLPSLHGIVLAGGKSSRMQTDKALLQYEDLPQWQVAANLLKPFAEQVYISVNEAQSQQWAKWKGENFVTDHPSFKDKGPISGILSAVELHPGKAFLVLGVDYPFLKLENLILLNNTRSSHYEAICFQKDGFAEPLCTIYEKDSLAKLKFFFENGGDSLQKFLKTLKTKMITLEQGDFLRNVNSKEEFLDIKNRKA